MRALAARNADLNTQCRACVSEKLNCESVHSLPLSLWFLHGVTLFRERKREGGGRGVSVHDKLALHLEGIVFH